MSAKSTGIVDQVIGRRIRDRRMAIRMSQERLGEILGVTFQQVQKYEKGVNRVGAGRLQAIADALGVPVSFFFDQTAAEGTDAKGLQDFLLSREGMELTQAFLAIDSPAMRRAIINLAVAAARDPDADPASAS